MVSDYQTYEAVVLAYAVLVLCVVPWECAPVFFLMGVIGQLLLYNMSFYIFRSRRLWSSVRIYALMYLLFVLSFTCLDMHIYLGNSDHFVGTLHDDPIPLFMDFVYFNISTVSTIGYGDITPMTTLARSYMCYKIAIVIFMIVFLVSDITTASKAFKSKNRMV